MAAAGLYVASRATLRLLADYARAGGHLVLGVRTGYADSLARARPAPAPPFLADAAGASYEECGTFAGEIALRVAEPARADAPDALPHAFATSPGAAARRLAEGLVPTGATALAAYDHPFYGRFAAITTRACGSGRVTYLGAVPNRALAEDVFRWVQPRPLSTALATLPDAVTLASGVIDEAGSRLVFLHNWGWDRAAVELRAPMLDPATREPVPAGAVTLGAWDCRALLSPAPH
jgi:beta-galactosidase